MPVGSSPAPSAVPLHWGMAEGDPLGSEQEVVQEGWVTRFREVCGTVLRAYERLRCGDRDRGR